MSTVKDLVIRAVSLAGQPLSSAITARFDAAGGTVGRSDSNTLALPDPRRHISRLQAEVVCMGGRFMLRNAGNANPINVNETSLAPGASSPIGHGDELQIGAYVLRVTLEDPQAMPRTGAQAPRALPAHTVIMASAAEPKTHPRRQAAPQSDTYPALARSKATAKDPARAQGMGAFDPRTGAQGAAGSNPFGDLLSPQPSAADAPGRVPEDYDPFADPVSAMPAASPKTGAAPDPIGALLPQAGASLDEIFGLDTVGPGVGKGKNILGDFLGEGPPTETRDNNQAGPPAGGTAMHSAPAVKLDPLAMFDAPAPALAPARPREVIPATVIPDHTPELHAFYKPPDVVRPAPAPAALPLPAPAAASMPVAAPPTVAALWRAFEQGAGLSPLPDEALTPELMVIIGRLLRGSVDGTLRLMSARAATKQELRAGVTVIQTRHNNPLKFTLDGQAALEQMLRPPMRGFMPATEAVQDAMDDLLGHAVGTMAGMRAALQGVLARFTPGQLEAALSEPSMLDKLLPMNRHAKLWELYLAHHARVKTEAEDRFDNLFGTAFVKAYEEQLALLEQTRNPRDATQ